MKLYLLLISLLLNCVNLEELKNAEPMNYLYGVVVANLRGSLAGSSNQATFQILYNGKEYLSGDTIEIRANKSNIEYSAEI
ncbi:MAG: hypothetical protein EBS19_13865, partial [Spirochaetia bacterium]|nr:hypothetical protein [Spirochaetia bacterium]